MNLPRKYPRLKVWCCQYKMPEHIESRCYKNLCCLKNMRCFPIQELAGKYHFGKLNWLLPADSLHSNYQVCRTKNRLIFVNRCHPSKNIRDCSLRYWYRLLRRTPRPGGIKKQRPKKPPLWKHSNRVQKNYFFPVAA